MSDEMKSWSSDNSTDLAKSNMEIVLADQELATFYNANASVGAENLSSELPTLKVHVTNKSKENQLQDGTEPNNGWFFYKGTQEQFQFPQCHILTISRGFRADGMEDDKETGKKKMVFNQIVGGIITNGNRELPFLMYFTGTRLSNLWAFGKDIRKYTRAKPVSIPMFALLVELKTRNQPTEFGPNFIIDFELMKEASGEPKIVTDMGKLVFLREMVDQLNETINRFIELKEFKKSEVIVPIKEAGMNAKPSGDGMPF